MSNVIEHCVLFLVGIVNFLAEKIAFEEVARAFTPPTSERLEIAREQSVTAAAQAFLKCCRRTSHSLIERTRDNHHVRRVCSEKRGAHLALSSQIQHYDSF
jgi:hypothetical protein